MELWFLWDLWTEALRASRCLTLGSPLVPAPLVPGSAQPHNAAAILRALACASQVLVPSCF